jgi:hypothetical protein
MAQAAPFLAGAGKFMAAAGPWIKGISAVLGGFNLLSSFKNERQAVQFQAQDMTTTANLFDLSSLQEGVRGLQEKVNVQDESRRQQARIRATYAARGITMDGSPEAVMYDSLTVSRRKEQAADFNADTSKIEQAMKAQMTRDQGRNQRKAGLSTATSNLVGGASNLLFSSINR